MSIPVVTVDGPSGTGKGTLSLHIAHTLGWHFLDSGALYRVLAHYGGDLSKVNIHPRMRDKVLAKYGHTAAPQ